MDGRMSDLKQRSAATGKGWGLRLQHRLHPDLCPNPNPNPNPGLPSQEDSCVTGSSRPPEALSQLIFTTSVFALIFTVNIINKG